MGKRRPPQPFADLYRYTPGGRESEGVEKLLRFCAAAVVHKGWHACFILRLSQWSHYLYLYPVAFLLSRFLFHGWGIDIPPETTIGPGLWMPHPQNIVVHRLSKIGEHVILFHGVTIGRKNYELPPTIMDRVAIYTNSSVLGDVTINSYAKIGAHSLVMSDVPRGEVWAGCPAEQIGGEKAKGDPDSDRQ